MARKKRKTDNLKGQKYRFEVNDFILAEDWSYTKLGRQFFDDDLLRIIDFFCLHSPCKQGSYSGLTLDILGWRNPWNSSRFRNRFIELLGLSEESFIYCDYQHCFKKEWEKLGLDTDYLSMRRPYVVIAAAGESNRYMDLLHRIRNSFAHGRFTVEKDHREYYLYFEDVKETNGYTCVLARACLTKSGMSRLLAFLARENGSAAGFESIIETH